MADRLRKAITLAILLACTVFVRSCDNYGWTWEFSLGPVASFLEFRTLALYGFLIWPVEAELLTFSFPLLLLNLASALGFCFLLYATGLFDRLKRALVIATLCFSAAVVFPIIQGLPLLLFAPLEMRETTEHDGASLIAVSRGLFLVAILLVSLARIIGTSSARSSRRGPESATDASSPRDSVGQQDSAA